MTRKPTARRKWHQSTGMNCNAHLRTSSTLLLYANLAVQSNILSRIQYASSTCISRLHHMLRWRYVLSGSAGCTDEPTINLIRWEFCLSRTSSKTWTPARTSSTSSSVLCCHAILLPLSSPAPHADDVNNRWRREFQCTWESSMSVVLPLISTEASPGGFQVGLYVYAFLRPVRLYTAFSLLVYIM